MISVKWIASDGSELVPTTDVNRTFLASEMVTLVLIATGEGGPEVCQSLL
jgi:hypothetical protein